MSDYTIQDHIGHLRQISGTDCTLTSIAMFLKIPYTEIRDTFVREYLMFLDTNADMQLLLDSEDAVRKYYLWHIELGRDYAESKGWQDTGIGSSKSVLYTLKNFTDDIIITSFFIYDLPCLISYFNHFEDSSGHMMYYDGEYILDPSHREKEIEEGILIRGARPDDFWPAIPPLSLFFYNLNDPKVSPYREKIKKLNKIINDSLVISNAVYGDIVYRNTVLTNEKKVNKEYKNYKYEKDAISFTQKGKTIKFNLLSSMGFAVLGKDLIDINNIFYPYANVMYGKGINVAKADINIIEALQRYGHLDLDLAELFWLFGNTEKFSIPDFHKLLPIEEFQFKCLELKSGKKKFPKKFNLSTQKMGIRKIDVKNTLYSVYDPKTLEAFGIHQYMELNYSHNLRRFDAIVVPMSPKSLWKTIRKSSRLNPR